MPETSEVRKSAVPSRKYHKLMLVGWKYPR